MAPCQEGQEHGSLLLTCPVIKQPLQPSTTTTTPPSPPTSPIARRSPRVWRGFAERSCARNVRSPGVAHRSNRYTSIGRCHASRKATEQWSKLRSLIVFGEVDSLPSLSSFQVLRVLQLVKCFGLHDNCFNDLGKLRHLRFLRLGDCRQIPESIGKLESLEIFEITNTCDTLMLPMSLAKLQKLVRLSNDYGVRFPIGLPLGDMKSLQELGVIDISSMEELKEIGNLKELRVLGIEISGDMVAESILMSLQRCTNFKKLHIATIEGRLLCSLDSMPLVPSSVQSLTFSGNCWMTSLPRWINSSTLSCLTTLAILFWEPPQPEDLEKLAELPSLRFLSLWFHHDRTSLHENLIVTSRGFRCLEGLKIKLSSVVVYVFQTGAMPELRRLKLFFTLDQEDIIPSGLENLRSLPDVIVYGEYVDNAAAVREALKDHPNRPSLELR